MGFNYTPGGATDRDDIRSAIGDTVSTAPLAERLEDEEIDRLLTVAGSSLPRAKVACARALLAKLARRASDRTIGSLRLSYTARVEALRAIIQDLQAELTGAGAAIAPYCGGISVADVEAVSSSTDRVAPAFTSGLLDNPRGA